MKGEPVSAARAEHRQLWPAHFSLLPRFLIASSAARQCATCYASMRWQQASLPSSAPMRFATAMQRDAGFSLTEMRVDGGASLNNMLLQFQADLLGLPVVRPRITETTALGAAYLAGLAVGFWQSQQEIAALWAKERTFTPILTAESAAAKMHDWLNAIERSKGLA